MQKYSFVVALYISMYNDNKRRRMYKVHILHSTLTLILFITKIESVMMAVSSVDQMRMIIIKSSTGCAGTIWWVRVLMARAAHMVPAAGPLVSL